MWRDVSVTDFVRNFADLINRVAYRGEHLRLRRGGRVLAEVHPAAAPPACILASNTSSLSIDEMQRAFGRVSGLVIENWLRSA